jgi:hypothetical protein
MRAHHWDCPRRITFAISNEDELQDCFDRSGIEWKELDVAQRNAAEDIWRSIFGRCLVPMPRHRQGAKADFEYAQQECDDYLVVPFTSNVPGLPVHVLDSRKKRAYRCCGRLIPFGQFYSVEFFVCPVDFAWTMIHTHEDHALGGPYFIRVEWLP